MYSFMSGNYLRNQNMFQVDDHRIQKAWEDAADEELWADQESICWCRDVYDTPNHRTMCENGHKREKSEIQQMVES